MDREYSYTYYLELVKKDGNHLVNIPFEFFTPTLLETAVRRSPETIQYVPKVFLSQRLCDLAVYEEPSLIKWVPNHYRTIEMCEFVDQISPSLSQFIDWERFDERLGKRKRHEPWESDCSTEDQISNKFGKIRVG